MRFWGIDAVLRVAGDLLSAVHAFGGWKKSGCTHNIDWVVDGFRASDNRPDKVYKMLEDGMGGGIWGDG